MANSLSLTIQTNHVAVITFDMPGSKMNLLSRAVLSELSETLDKVAANKDVVGLVFASAKPGVFFAGANIEEIVTVQADKKAAYDAVASGKAVFQKIIDLGKRMPTVAAINGICLGGGMELALACSIRVAVQDADLGLPEVALGILPGWGGCVRLTKLIGAKDAMTIITAPLKRVNARKAHRMGIVDEVVKPEKLTARAEALALGVAPKRAKQAMTAQAMRWFIDRTSIGRNQFIKGANAAIAKETKGNYPAPPAVLEVVLAALTKPEAEAMELESKRFSELAVTEVSKSLVGLFFAQQDAKKPPANVRPTVKAGIIGVCGAGVMGSGIAQCALEAGYVVILYDKFPAGLQKGANAIHAALNESVKRGKLGRMAAENMLTSLALTTEVSGLKSCDLIIESIFEDMKLKQDLLADLEKVKGGKPFIFATNTSALGVTEMMSKAANPGNTGGLHFFNPPPRMPLVEIVLGEKTSPETVATLKEFSLRMRGKVAVVTADKPGFAVNRVLIPYGYETVRLAEQGVSAHAIEEAMVSFGMPMGPLEVLDVVGLDIAGKVIHLLHDALGARLTPPKLLTWIEAQKLTGKKGGKGIYIWENGKKVGINPDLKAALAATPKEMSIADIQERLVLVMVNEASRCIEEKVVASAAELDLTMIYGCGFPPFRGGILRYADTLGAAEVVKRLQKLQAEAGENYKPSALLLEMAANGKKFYDK